MSKKMNPLPKFQMAPRFKILNILWVQERNPDILSFSLKKSQEANPLQVPQRGPYGERYPLTGHFYTSLNISLFIFPSESLVREPPPCSLTGSPMDRNTPSSQPLVHLFIHSCMSAESPKRSPPAYVEKYKVTIHGAPRTRKAYIQWGVASFPKGIVNDTAISTPVPCSILKETTENVTRRTQVLHLY
jgi:hypothetical protein